MNSFYQSYLTSVEKGLEELNLRSEPQQLYDPIKYILSLGGKRVRPILALMGADLYNGDKRDALNIALCIELFHNFTLIHDDIMDEAPIRRGKETVHKRWNQNVAILSGDAMLIKAYDLLSTCKPDYIGKLLAVFNDTAFKVCEGQQFDMDFEDLEIVGMDAYLKMIEYKTSVLLGAALQMGAISAGADDHQCELLYNFGLQVGMAFQLKDDWLDVYGDPEKFGKTKGGDIMASKKTFLMIQAISSSDDLTKNKLQSLLSINSEDRRDEKIKGVIEIYDQLNVGEALKEKMDEYFQKALSLTQKIIGEGKILEELLQLSHSLMDRDQ